MSSFPMDIRRQAREFVEARKPSGEVDALLDIKPGTVREGNTATCGIPLQGRSEQRLTQIKVL